MCLASSTNSHQGLTLPNFEGYTPRKNVQRCSMSLPDPCLTYTTNSTHPRTPLHPCIDQTRSKGTPRRHKTPKRIRNPGIKSPCESIHKIQEESRRKLKLTFTPEEWQACLIQRVKQGHDSIFLAGTGYGKSLVLKV